AALIAEAAASEVFARVVSAPVSAVCILAAVISEVAPMVNSPAPGVAEVVAVSVIVSSEPSGRVNVNLTCSPAFGLVAPTSTDMAGGAPAGGDTVEPARDEVILASLKPKMEGAASSA